MSIIVYNGDSATVIIITLISISAVFLILRKKNKNGSFKIINKRSQETSQSGCGGGLYNDSMHCTTSHDSPIRDLNSRLSIF